MKKHFTSIKFEQILYGVIFLVGLLLRLLNLGKVPLNDEEAQLALQALSLAQGNSSAYVNPDSGYLVITSALFFVFAASDFTARLAPAILGSLICLIPYTFRDLLGRKAALLISVGLALDGAWLAAARGVGSLTWAVLFVLLMIWAISARRWERVGVFAGLSLLGGVDVWKGLLPFGIAVGVYLLWFDRNDGQLRDVLDSLKRKVGAILIWAGGTVLIIGSLFLLTPAGLSGVGGGIVNYLRGWSNPSDVSVGLILAALLIYQPVIILFGLAASIRQFGQPAQLDRFFVVWWLIAFLHTLLYPAREVVDVVWVSLPLIGLAARLLSLALRFDFEERVAALIYSGVVFAFLVFAFQNIMAIYSPGRVVVNIQPQVITALAAATFVVASIVLIGWGWSTRIAGYGALWGFLTLLTIFWISSGFHAAGLSGAPEANPFFRRGIIGDADLLKGTIQDLSELNVRSRKGLDILAVGVDQPALRWLAREFPSFVFENTFQPQMQNSIILTKTAEEVSFKENYRGQDFDWKLQSMWDLMTSQEWMRWAIFKIAPHEKETIILWAREDLFPGSETSAEVKP